MDKLAQLDAEQSRHSTAVDLGIPTYREIAGRDGTSLLRRMRPPQHTT